jgi:hypothetical protein
VRSQAQSPLSEAQIAEIIARVNLQLAAEQAAVELNSMANRSEAFAIYAITRNTAVFARAIEISEFKARLLHMAFPPNRFVDHFIRNTPPDLEITVPPMWAKDP